MLFALWGKPIFEQKQVLGSCFCIMTSDIYAELRLYAMNRRGVNSS